MTALPEPQAGASARPWRVLADLARSDCPVDWMRVRLPDNAIPTGQDLPSLREKAIGWLSDPGVCIWFIPAIVWRTPSSPGIDDEWWSGLPGHYLDLRRDRWHLSHWLPLSGVNSHDPLVAALRLALPIIEEDEADTRTGITPAGEAVREALRLAAPAPAREEGRLETAKSFKLSAERIRFVETTLGNDVICGQCGARLADYTERCNAPLDVPCEGFQAIERALRVGRTAQPEPATGADHG